MKFDSKTPEIVSGDFPHFRHKPSVQSLFSSLETQKSLRLKTLYSPLKYSVYNNYLYLPPTQLYDENDRGMLIVFSEIGTFLWQTFQETPSFTLSDAVTHIVQKFSLNETDARTQAISILNEWHEVGLLSII